jgi:hypothetical protein
MRYAVGYAVKTAITVTMSAIFSVLIYTFWNCVSLSTARYLDIVRFPSVPRKLSENTKISGRRKKARRKRLPAPRSIVKAFVLGLRLIAIPHQVALKIAGRIRSSVTGLYLLGYLLREDFVPASDPISLHCGGFPFVKEVELAD